MSRGSSQAWKSCGAADAPNLSLNLMHSRVLGLKLGLRLMSLGLGPGLDLGLRLGLELWLQLGLGLRL